MDNFNFHPLKYEIWRDITVHKRAYVMAEGNLHVCHLVKLLQSPEVTSSFMFRHSFGTFHKTNQILQRGLMIRKGREKQLADKLIDLKLKKSQLELNSTRVLGHCITSLWAIWTTRVYGFSVSQASILTLYMLFTKHLKIWLPCVCWRYLHQVERESL